MSKDPYKTLKEEALVANMEIPRRNLAIYSLGNVSAFDPAKAVFAIKPSGVSFDRLDVQSMVVVDLDGKVVDGDLHPSLETETHRILYRDFSVLTGEEKICGIAHIHSPYAVAWAQARFSVPVFGTTHADHGAEKIPCTDIMSADAVNRNYEMETGILIVETFIKRSIDPIQMPMVLVAGHGPFTWGKTAARSIYNAAVLEEVCKMAFLTLSLNPDVQALPEYIIKKHWERKHGPGAYYGQK